MSCLVGVVGMLYRRRPRTRTILPTMKFELKLVPPGRYGNGFDIMYTDNGTESTTAREETIAEDIFTRWSTEMLKARLVAIYSSGSIGAPSQPAILAPVLKKQPAPSFIYERRLPNGIPFKFESKGNNRNTKRACTTTSSVILRPNNKKLFSRRRDKA